MWFGPGEYVPDPTEGITNIKDLPAPRIVIEHLIQDALVLPIVHRREDTVRPLIEFIDCDVA